MSSCICNTHEDAERPRHRENPTVPAHVVVDLVDKLERLHRDINEVSRLQSRQSEAAIGFRDLVTHRACRPRHRSVVCARPADFAAPAVVAAPGCTRAQLVAAVRADFVRRTLEGASEGGSAERWARVMHPTDVLYLTGKYARHGPYLWGEVYGGPYVLLSIHLWPARHRSSLLPTCLAGDLSPEVLMVDGASVVQEAEAQLPPDSYEGVCELPSVSASLCACLCAFWKRLFV